MSQQSASTQSQQRAKAEPKKHESALEDKQLDQVSGGAPSLSNACATGKHIPDVKITT